MLKKKKTLKDLDRNELLIKWADELIFHSNHLGKINKNSLMPGSFQTPQQIEVWRRNEEGRLRNHVIALLGDTKGNVDIQTNEMASYLEGIKNHLLSHRYIKEPTPPDYDWELTERGWSVKELGGHFAYQKHRKREINILKHQNTINWLLFSTAAASVAIPFIIAIFFSPKNIINVYPQIQSSSQNDTVLVRQLIENVLKEKKTSRDTMPPK